MLELKKAKVKANKTLENFLFTLSHSGGFQRVGIHKRISVKHSYHTVDSCSPITLTQFVLIEYEIKKGIMVN